MIFAVAREGAGGPPGAEIGVGKAAVEGFDVDSTEIDEMCLVLHPVRVVAG